MQLRAIVSGLVQGVFFRHHTVQEAKKLGLKGFVQNLPDGRVEVLAVGEKRELQALLKWLEHGPSGCRVKKVEASWPEGERKFRAFSIKY